MLSERLEERLQLHVGPDGVCGPGCGDAPELGGECGAGGHGGECAGPGSLGVVTDGVGRIRRGIGAVFFGCGMGCGF